MVGNRNITSIRDSPYRDWVEPQLQKTNTVRVLLVEDNLEEARLLQEILKGTVHQHFVLVHVKRLGEAIAHLQAHNTDIALLDLTLPDSTGLASLDTLIAAMPRLPIVVLTNTNDEDLAVQAVRRGAQDYLLKRQVNQELLVRSLRYAIERKQAEDALREANEVLEQRVQERTAALEHANTQLQDEIEHRKRIQERLELARQAGNIGTFEWNLETHALTWDSPPNTTSDPSQSSLTATFAGDYRIWLQTLHPDDRAVTATTFCQTDTVGSTLDTEFRLLSNNEQAPQWIAVKGRVFADEQGETLRMIGIHMDITEKKQLEAQFLRAQRLESLGTLASGIAHDLNNLLTPMLGVVELLPLKVPHLDEQAHYLLNTLETSAHRGADLVKQILSFARGIEGKRVSLQIDHIWREVKQMLEQTLPKSITIRSEVAANLWSVVGDTTQLHQVLMNLCVNARDAMPHGGELIVSAQNQVLNAQAARAYMDGVAGDYVVVTVADTGAGMTESILQRIFDPFFTTKDLGKGTGLGLSAVLGIIKNHSGFIDVQSQMGQGSQFRIFLPATDHEVMKPEINLEAWKGGQELILVVDDETAICEITKTALETYNYRVLTANNGKQAIALMTEHRHDIHCVLMDLMMPNLDGLMAIPLLRRLKPDLYAIAMSGLNSTEAVAETERLGFQSFLAKPFTTQELLQALHQSVAQ